MKKGQAIASPVSPSLLGKQIEASDLSKVLLKKFLIFCLFI